MPAVDVAMRRSLRGGFLDLLAASLRPALQRRDIQGEITDVKMAFSSWDNCMQATYCKWPVIAIIIIGGLIIASIIWCIVRCACCGLSCCCSCFQCFKCCGNCCGCCDPPRGSRNKYLDEPYIPPNQQYKPQEPMNPAWSRDPGYAMGPMSPAVSRPAAAAAAPPQFAEFDAKSGAAHEDALPAMPVWDEAGSKKVLVEEEAVELKPLNKPEANAQNPAMMAGAIAQNPSRSPENRSPYGPPLGIPGRGQDNRSPYGPSPGHSPEHRSPYGPPGNNPPTAGYFPPGGVESDPYAQNGQDYHQARVAYGQGPEQGYGVPVAAIGQGRRSPRMYNDGGYQDDRGSAAPTRQNTYDNYGGMPGRQQQQGGYDQVQQGGYDQAQQGGYDSYGAQGVGQGYGAGGPRRAPRDRQIAGYPQDQMRGSPAPQADYGGAAYDSRPNTGRNYSSESTRPLRGPQRQYSHDVMPTPVTAGGQVDDGGRFDFSSAYSRPAAAAAAANQNSYRQASPAIPEPQQSAYLGYKPYQPGQQQQQQQQQGWSGL
ncbi:hypothetical protein B0T17DRAFT_509750 [Bombardia bombarda]|uniref:Fibroin-3 related protein n=1 Tax=Bombardia bombarda TaxID=252184 RepID=A0AA40BYF8_9PEZI|nr:hypothetical protein B0T17DRAFT_509750 [Bombardia bombarda]